MIIIKIIIGLILLYVLCKIHEAWVLIKWGIIELEETDDHNKVINDIKTKVFNSDEDDVNNDKTRINIYGPYSKQSAEIRAKNSQFIEGSIILIQTEENLFSTYEFNDYTLTKYTKDDENVVKAVVDYIHNYATTSQLDETNYRVITYKECGSNNHEEENK